jgi:hypothetical protein
MLYLNLDDNGAPLSALLCRSKQPRLEVRFIAGYRACLGERRPRCAFG